jgi:membrane associated rhomboid family serine protease
LGAWFLEQLYFGVADLSHPTGGGVAYFAHIGGFAFGLIFVRAFATRVRRPPEPRLPAY